MNNRMQDRDSEPDVRIGDRVYNKYAYLKPNAYTRLVIARSYRGTVLNIEDGRALLRWDNDVVAWMDVTKLAKYEPEM